MFRFVVIVANSVAVGLAIALYVTIILTGSRVTSLRLVIIEDLKNSCPMSYLVFGAETMLVIWMAMVLQMSESKEVAALNLTYIKSSLKSAVVGFQRMYSAMLSEYAST